MKIVHVCLCGPVTDGWSYQDNLLPKYHKILGNDVTVITSKWVWGNDGNLFYFDKTNYLNDDNVKMIRLNTKRKKVFAAKFKRYEALQKALETEKPDVLFIHGCQFLDIKVVVNYLKQHLKISTYVDNHADFNNSATNWLSKNILHKFIWKKYAQSILPYTKKFWAITPDSKRFLLKLYAVPDHKIDFLFLGADIPSVSKEEKDSIRKAIRKKHDIPENNVVLITGGKIDRLKQTNLLLDAVKKIENPKLNVIVFGTISEDMRGILDRKFSDDNRIRYIGWLDSSKITDYYWASDIAVFPGSQSVVWQQAIASGLPCIFKRWYGIEYLDLGGNCLFLENDDVNELSEKIQILLNNNTRKKMANISNTKGVEVFSYQNIAKKSIELG